MTSLDPHQKPYKRSKAASDCPTHAETKAKIKTVKATVFMGSISRTAMPNCTSPQTAAAAKSAAKEQCNTHSAQAEAALSPALA